MDIIMDALLVVAVVIAAGAAWVGFEVFWNSRISRLA